VITFYSIVRGFEKGEWYDTQTPADFDWAEIQTKAILSWQELGDEVVLFGENEPGAAEAAAALGCAIYPVARNKRGVPLVGDAIERIHDLASYDIKCLVNADILLPPEFRAAVTVVSERFDSFLLSTQRRDGNELKPRGAIDVFFHRGGWLRGMPPFAVGRTSWDNWIVAKALQKDIPVVDGTSLVVCIHQSHPKTRSSGETKANRRLYRLRHGTLRHATWVLNSKGELVKR